MASLQDKIKTALDESRILILGSQVLLGFGFRSVFESGFEKLPRSSHIIKLASLAILLLVIGLLMSPGAYHRIVWSGEETEDLHRYTTTVMDIALLPFAAALGVELFLATALLAGTGYALTAGVAATLAALFVWYGLGWFRNHSVTISRNGKGDMESKKQASELKSKIDHVLQEARVVLPGAQALLGFQFATMLLESFEKLPASSKYIHLASLVLMMVSVILLMAPAAYHRIAEKGEETEKVVTFASWMLLLAMVPLPLAIAGDFFVVTRKVTQSATISIASSVVVLLFFYSLWFGYSSYRKHKIVASRAPS